MTRTLSEKKVLNKLGIQDFRHMTKEKVVEFATLLHRMDPEVAKAAIAQFPEYVKLASEMVNTYRDIVSKMLEANAANMKAFTDACNSIILSIQQQLQNNDLSENERDSLNERMIRVATMIGDKISEDKRFWLQVLGYVGSAFVGLGSIAFFIFGKGKFPTSGSTRT